ncbi:hypothetical protein EUTSA_v10029516mg [Eutrema salsugineum]|uniref:Uncharacterized protein n=1 Tax=Eutrema salsugineum TaxID=72664 RepID=V4LDU7_EUTSA|nr:hypothetical protein EUTSA_v10029516mg [Eutrema salsugineum]
MYVVVVVDALTDSAFKGNPTVREDSWLQSLAADFNLPMASFVTLATSSSPPHLSQRCVLKLFLFYVLQVDLCGHSTLASTHALFSDGSDTSKFSTHWGILLTAKRISETRTLELSDYVTK